MFWYQVQMSLDEKDQFELLRDIAEHNAMFMNPEGVQQVRDSRENIYETPNDDFNKNLKDTFGRDISKIDENEKIDFHGILQRIDSKKIDPYLNMDLDKVDFIPFK